MSRSILAGMLRHLAALAVRFAVIVALLASVVLGVGGGCGPLHQEIWICLNPATGKLDDLIYDENHYADGVFDPCHCYDPCGAAKTCPILVDAGPPGPGCDAGDASDGGP